MRVRDLTVAFPPTWTVEEVAGGHVMRDANRDVGPVYGTVRIGSAQEEAATNDEESFVLTVLISVYFAGTGFAAEARKVGFTCYWVCKEW